MLTRLTLRHFRNHSDTTLDGLKPLSVIVGPNGGGKASILEAIRALYLLGENAPEVGLAGGRGANELVRSRASDMTVAGTGTFGEQRWSIAASFVLVNQRWTSSVKVGHSDSPVEKSPEWMVSGLKQAARYRLQAPALREPSYSESVAPTIGQDGYGLASAVSYLVRTDPDAHRLLSQRLRQIVPSVTGLRTSPVKIPRTRRHTVGVDGLSVPLNGEDEVVGDELLFDTVDGEGIPGAAQSDGTLLVLAVLTALALPTRARLLLLDHIDAGLHPAAQRELMRVLRKQVDDNPGLQLIMTTHSPYVVDEMSPDEVWVCGRDAADEHVVVRKLSEHPRAEEALRVLTTGEFWSTEGEDWTAEKAG